MTQLIEQHKYYVVYIVAISDILPNLEMSVLNIEKISNSI